MQFPRLSFSGPTRLPDNAARWSTVVVLLGSVVVLAGCPTRPVGPPRSDATYSSAATTPEPCLVAPVERRPLVLQDGTEAYVEPMNLMRVGSDFVVVGAPTYSWRVGAPRVVMATDGAHLAAYLDAEAPRLVDTPIDLPPGIVRSIALDDHRWGVLFSEADPEAFSPLSVATALWYTEYDGVRWSEVEPVPMPDGYDLFVGSSSPLVAVDGSLSWTVVTGEGGEVVHFRRRSGAWQFEVMDERGMEAAALASGPSGAWLALSGVDPDLPVRTKSVRLFRWEAGWRFVRRVATVEPYTQIRTISLAVAPAGVTATWREVGDEGATAMARVGIGTDAPGALLTVDTNAGQAKPLETPDGVPSWIVQHVDPVTGLDELRLVRGRDSRAEVIWAIPYPYTGYFAALAAGPDEVLVTGSEFSPDPSRPTVRSLTLRLSSSCQ